MDTKKIIQWIAGIALVALIFGFGYHLYTLTLEGTESQSSASITSFDQSSVVVVDGVQTVTLSWGKFNYNPETITVQSGTPVQITADLDRLQGCFRSFVVPNLGINAYFDENNPSFEFTPTKTGTFAFSCSMGMGKGTLIVT